MRKEVIATLLISTYWIIAGFFVAYSAWESGFRASGNYGSEISLPDPFSLGLLLAVIGLVFSFIILRTMLPSRATQRRKLMRLLDEIGVEDIDAIQRKLNAVSALDDSRELERVASLRSLLQEQKRKNSVD